MHTYLSATIENIAKDNRNLNYINKFISNFNINPSLISKVIFKNSYCFISFTTLYAKDSFISLNPLLKTTDYNRLFLHNYLSPEIIRRKHIYFHAIKANLIKGYKYLLNLKTNTYELRQKIDNNKVNWKTKPLNVPNELFTDWTTSFTNYINNKDELTSTTDELTSTNKHT